MSLTKVMILIIKKLTLIKVFYKNLNTNKVSIDYTNRYILDTLPVTRFWGLDRKKGVGSPKKGYLPKWIADFDWVIGWSHGYSNKKKIPNSIFCHPELLGFFSLYLIIHPQLSKKLRNTIIIFGGEDTKLSRQKTFFLKKIKRTFKDVYYEAKDVEDNIIKIMPIGLTEFYIRSFEETLENLIQKPNKKSNLLLSSFGYHWPKLNKKIPDRSSAAKFSEDKDFVTNKNFDTDEYLTQLSIHKYLIVPLGNGVQSPKLIESILMECIPIMTKSVASIELQKIGFPILIVEIWNDITKELLENRFNSLNKEVVMFKNKILNYEKYRHFTFH
jgi:hypothetical protein